jgi:hypothetical protein
MPNEGLSMLSIRSFIDYYRLCRDHGLVFCTVAPDFVLCFVLSIPPMLQISPHRERPGTGCAFCGHAEVA